MDQQQKNRKDILKVLLVFGGILLLVLLAGVIYFYTIGEIGDNDKDSTSIACGCYMIDPAVINDCGDPKRAFLFNINRVDSDQTCSAQCDTNQITENLLNSTTPKDSYKSCTVRSISDTRCENMLLKDGNDKIITGKITESDEINVEATFDLSTYTNYLFKINSNTVEPDSIDGNKISKKITDLGETDSIEIVATATDSQGDSINSIVCRRVVDITRTSGTGVNSLSVSTGNKSDGTTEVTQVNISVGQVDSENVKIRFSFDNGTAPIVATDGITVATNKGSVSMSKVDLYDNTNFDANKSFSVLDSYEGDLTITAQVLIDDVSIGSASTEVTFLEASEGNEQEDPQEEETEKSSFTTNKAVTPTCVERTGENSTATFTITIKNNGDTPDTIASVKDKLPLGFTYETGSTVINGTTTPDTSLVTVTPVGDSQEVLWEPSTPWSVEAGANLVIVFESTVGESAITGQNLNEVIVNPEEIPTDPSTLRAEATITVAQDCDNPPTNEVPSTGILDSMITRILLGILVLTTGWFVYTRPEGTALSRMIVGSDLYRDAEMFKYRITNPRKYFEAKILRNSTKENQSRKK